MFRVPSYFGFLENEVTASRKLYFYDNGIRNAILGAYQPVTVRPDAPALMGEFPGQRATQTAECAARACGRALLAKHTATGSQLSGEARRRDFGMAILTGRGKKPVRFPKTFTKNYGPVAQEEVRPDNFHDFFRDCCRWSGVAVPAGEAMNNQHVPQRTGRPPQEARQMRKHVQTQRTNYWRRLVGSGYRL